MQSVEGIPAGGMKAGARLGRSSGRPWKKKKRRRKGEVGEGNGREPRVSILHQATQSPSVYGDSSFEIGMCKPARIKAADGLFRQ